MAFIHYSFVGCCFLSVPNRPINSRVERISPQVFILGSILSSLLFAMISPDALNCKSVKSGTELNLTLRRKMPLSVCAEKFCATCRVSVCFSWHTVDIFAAFPSLPSFRKKMKPHDCFPSRSPVSLGWSQRVLATIFFLQGKCLCFARKKEPATKWLLCGHWTGKMRARKCLALNLYSYWDEVRFQDRNNTYMN